MLNKCQLILATGGTVAQDLTMQWSTMGGFMQELSLLVIDEGQQYGTDREIAVISLLRQQPLVLWTGDSEQTPGGIDRAARNAKRSRQLLLAKKHGLRSDRNYYMPANLADAMIRLLDQYESTIQAVHIAARTHTQKSKGTVGPAVDYRPQGEALPVISADLTSELLHCLSTLPDPWPLAKIHRHGEAEPVGLKVVQTLLR